MIHRNVPETLGADVAAVVLEARGCCELTVLAAIARPAASANTIVEWPSEKKKPDAQRPLALLEELPRRVVDRRDVVGVEGVPQPEGVGEGAQPRERRVCRE